MTVATQPRTPTYRTGPISLDPYRPWERAQDDHSYVPRHATYRWRVGLIRAAALVARERAGAL